jgi:hypothetical protein
MYVGQPCTPTNVVWKGGLSEIFQIEINNEEAGVALVASNDRPATA